ncbi:aquaporin-like protein [Mycena albidolilacea]|uniref:Aquaporin-like protein n=1 Tax=Mycena albidolilacea TaxID=1033008 RepID=A0AAD7A8D0_9AGAR|nr:aquaporin-like protein [Mycena albidolilacea]
MSNLVHLSDIRGRRPRAFAAFERHRHTSVHWLVECFAEALGVFLYTYAGVGSQALYVIGNILEIPGASSTLQIGFAYACGILLAITVCSATSGGHFNPAITITNLVFNRFPPLKGLRYLAAQILGGYIACLLVYVQYKTLILDTEAVLLAAGPKGEATFYTPSGPGGIFALSLPLGSNLGRAFINEFVVDVVLGITIFATLDPTNTLLPPAVGPMVISLAYAVAIWSFSANGLAANAARDVGGRLAALTIWGMPAAGGSYAALAALTNIPATLLAYVLYELMLTDSDRVVPAAHVEIINAHKNHRRLRALASDSDENFERKEKEHVTEVERV